MKKRPLLILACSHLKAGKACQAKHMYKGRMFKAGYAYARRQRWGVAILSAKYGIIRPDTVIEPYDEKLKSMYDGDWPNRWGYYLGSPLYFGNAPSRFQPLVPAASPGTTASYITRLDTIGREALFKWAASDRRGVIQAIYETLMQRSMTKDELFDLLFEEFQSSGVRQTINAQLIQTRIGKERKCTVRRKGDVFWLEPGLPE